MTNFTRKKMIKLRDKNYRNVKYLLLRNAKIKGRRFRGRERAGRLQQSGVNFCEKKKMISLMIKNYW